VLKRKFKRAINIPDRSTITRLHLIWIATVCGKLKADFRYSNTLGGRTFPVPTLTDQNKADLTRSAEDILLAREQYFPATIPSGRLHQRRHVRP
jgi:hypothetical protein